MATRGGQGRGRERVETDWATNSVLILSMILKF